MFYILICSIFIIIIRNSSKEGDNFIDNKIINIRSLAYRLMVNNSPTLSTYVEKLETCAFYLTQRVLFKFYISRRTHARTHARTHTHTHTHFISYHIKEQKLLINMNDKQKIKKINLTY